MNNVNGSDIKIVFFGTPEFAVPVLKALINSEFKPVAVFCAPDKPVGRHQVLIPPPTKILAQKHNIPVYQPKDKNKLANQIETENYDLIICVAFGIILTKEILELPKYGCLNIHPSLLPKYRGPSPIQYTILNGDTETGTTIIKIIEKVDAGPIIAQEKINIKNTVIASPVLTGSGNPVGSDNITGLLRPPQIRDPRNDKLNTPKLSKILSNLSSKLLLKTLPDYLAGKIIPKKQDESLAIYTKIIKKEDGQINWQKSANEIERQIRAFFPWPSAYSQTTDYQPLIIKILEADILENNTDKQSGEIFLTADNRLAVQTGDGALVIKKLQLGGGKPLTTTEFLHGHQNIIKQRLI